MAPALRTHAVAVDRVGAVAVRYRVLVVMNGAAVLRLVEQAPQLLHCRRFAPALRHATTLRHATPSICSKKASSRPASDSRDCNWPAWDIRLRRNRSALAAQRDMAARCRRNRSAPM